MGKRALRKDFYIEIKKSLNRFLSIFLIVALGVAFFAGIRATDPDMRLTADSYYDSSNLMDIRILSTMGLTEEDVTAISEAEGVEKAEPAYFTDVLCDAKGNDLVLQVISLTHSLNQYTVKKGRLPEKADEVLVDEAFITSSGYDIGDSISLSSGTDQELAQTLKKDNFTIVGIGTTPYYLSFQRGSSSIGNGKINSFIVVLPEVFSMDVYSCVYVSAQDAKELTAYTDKYDDAVTDTADNIKKISDQRCQLRYNELYNSASQEIDKSKKTLAEKKTKAEEEQQTALSALQNSGLGEAELQASLKKLQEGKEEADKQFAEAEGKINDAMAQLTNITKPQWYVLDRSSVEAYVEYEQNADRIGAIGKVFPVIFFLVAALISLTTMTRMVEEERIQIGILKALGYSKNAIAMKYILYALLATLGGSLFGAAVGLKLLPTVIITAYKILYSGIPKIITPFNVYYASLAMAFSVFCVGLATFIACYKELLSRPANLMRPAAPKIGKRVILEKIPIIWKHLNFTWKATVRNMLRYKKRFFMTIFGIGGCMALLMVGFGLRDSIFVIYTRQFDQIMVYDASVSLESKATVQQRTDLEEVIDNNPKITSSLRVKAGMADISFQGTTKSVAIIVPEDAEKFKDYIVLRKRVGHHEILPDNKGIILTEQVAKQLGAGIGDTITVKTGDRAAQLTISDITENYMTHYLYMTPELYQTAFGIPIEYNEYFLLMPELNEEEQLQLGNSLLTYPAANGISYTREFQNMLSHILESLNIVVWVLIVSAGALAFVVSYNLNNININERRRELATIKVLGFYNNEMAAYIFRENILLTIIGTLFGIFLGIILHRYVIETVEIDLVMFGRNINPISYIYSVLLTFLFSAIVNIVMYFKIKRINMVESLKSVE